MKKTSSLALMFLLSFAPLAYAQEAADTPAASNDPTTSAPVTETTAAPDPTPAIQTPDAADAPVASATPDVPVAASPLERINQSFIIFGKEHEVHWFHNITANRFRVSRYI